MKILVVYCKILGHIKKDCYKLNRKKKLQSKLSTQVSNLVAVKDEPKNTSSMVDCVSNEALVRSKFKDSVIEINSFNDVNCKLHALINTGSENSFIKSSIYKIFCDQQVSCI